MSGDDDPPTPTTGAAFARLQETVAATDSDVVTRTEGERAARANDVDGILRAVIEACGARHATVTTIGAGGMGSVDLVTDRALERRAVMKKIHEHLADDPRTVAMFVREAQITGQLEHPNIVPVHDLGVGDRRSLYFTMKLVEGRTLEQIVRELPPGPLERDALADMLDIVIRVCDALAFAHSRGVLHLDVKPANVMIGDFGEVYLMDWGVARRLGGEAQPETAPGTAVLVGTPAYMAPEQALGRNDELDERADVFAVGGLVYQILVRRPPYQGEHFWATVSKAQQCQSPPIAEIPGVPRALARIVARAMALEPADRFQTISALQQELVRFVRGGDSFPLASFAAGDAIVREGEPGDAAYIIESGRCEVSRTIDGKKTIVREMGAGEVFGEMAILAPGPRTATVVALEPTTAHVVTAETLDREVDAMKPWMGAFVRTLAARFREREEK